METPLSRLDVVQKKYTELLQDMKRIERDHIKAKKRADQLQKEKDSGRTELNRVNTMKDKLEKLSRDVTKENKKLKVGFPGKRMSYAGAGTNSRFSGGFAESPGQ